MSECQKCKKKPLSSYNTLITVTSIYLLITSVAGTYYLIKLLLNLF
jgi:hypothetical protein